MKSLVPVAVAATALLGACASTPPSNASATASAGYYTNAYGREVDQRQIDAINSVARTNGVDVHWINYPEAKAPSAAGPLPGSTGT